MTAKIDQSDHRLTENELYRATELLEKINGVGCCLHITVSDLNLGDDSVRFCQEEAHRRQHPDCIELAELVLRMSITQRSKLSRGGYKGFIEMMQTRKSREINEYLATIPTMSNAEAKRILAHFDAKLCAYCDEPGTLERRETKSDVICIKRSCKNHQDRLGSDEFFVD